MTTDNQVFNRFLATLPDDPRLSLKCEVQFDTDDDNQTLSHWFVTLQGSYITEESDYDRPFTVATVKLAIADIDMWDHETAYDAFDYYSADTSELASATMEHWEENNRLVIIERVTVEPEYRGHGLAPITVIAAVTKLGFHRMAALLMLEAGCIEDEGLTASQKKKRVAGAARSWKRAGFKKVSGNSYVLPWDEISLEETEGRIINHLVKKSVSSI